MKPRPTFEQMLKWIDILLQAGDIIHLDDKQLDIFETKEDAKKRAADAFNKTKKEIFASGVFDR